MDINRLIRDSFQDALKSLVMGTSPAALIRARERVFIKALAEQLQAAHDGEGIRVLSAYERGNVADFGTERLLFDISVCRVALGKTAERRPEEFFYLAEVLCQIEINFSRDWREAIFAINRLNSGQAAQKLLLLARDNSGDNLLETLKVPFAAGGGSAWLALVPHPADWGDDELGIDIWQLVDDAWQAVE